MKQPTLSVVVANYNHGRFLPEMIQAVLDQSYRPLEFIILDDASTDQSIQIIDAFASKDPMIRVVRNERNMGILHNLNRLLELSSGDYLYAAAADDKVLPGLLEKSMAMLAQYPQAGLCSALVQLIDEVGKDTGRSPTPIIANDKCFLSPEHSLRALRQFGSWMTGNSAIYRRDALLGAGGFLPDLGSFCDGFAQQVIALRHGACFIPEVLAAWRRMDTGYASTTKANWMYSLQIGAEAERFMCSTFRDLFPADYVESWKRQWLFAAGRSAWEAVDHQREKFVSDAFVRLHPEPSWLDRLFLAGLGWCGWGQSWVVKVYLLLSLKYFPVLIRYRLNRARRLAAGLLTRRARSQG